MVSTTIPSRVKLRMAERSAVESIRRRLVSTEKAHTRRSVIQRNRTSSRPSAVKRRRIIPQYLLTEITIRLDAHIRRVMPSHVESQGFNRSCITQVMQLLQEQHADYYVQIFRRTPPTDHQNAVTILGSEDHRKDGIDRPPPKNDPAAGAASGPSLTNDQPNRGSVCHAM